MYLFTSFLGIYWLGLFIYLIVLYIKGIKHKKLCYFKLINKISWINIILIGVYEILYSSLDKSNDLGIIFVWFLGAVSAIALFISFLISLTTSKLLGHKLDETTNKFTKNIIIILIINIILIGVGISPLIHDIYRREKYSKYIVSYLTEKYGDGAFEVTSINDQRGKLWNSSNTYEFNIISSYLSVPFQVEIDISTKEIVDSSFLNSYAINKKICKDGGGISNCMTYYVNDEFNQKLTHKDIYNPILSVNLNEKDIKENFGHIPETSELRKYAKIEFNYFMIEKQFTKDEEQEFINYVLDMYKDYQEYFEKYDNHDDKNRIKFRLRYSNPFTTASAYNHDGYIRIENDEIFIYNKPSPIIISKDKLVK